MAEESQSGFYLREEVCSKPEKGGTELLSVCSNSRRGKSASSSEFALDSCNGPFGEVVKSSGSYAAENVFKFSTKYMDTETDLHYYGYRYYDAEQGRWLNRDPVAQIGTQLWFRRYFGIRNMNRLAILAISEQKLHSQKRVLKWIFDTISFNLLSTNTKEELADVLNINNFNFNDGVNNLDLLGLCGGSLGAGVTAAQSASDLTNSRPAGSRIEWCGLVCKKCTSAGPVFDFTGPFEGKAGSCNPFEEDCPVGFKPDSIYHSHPEDQPPGAADQAASNGINGGTGKPTPTGPLPGFVCTPNGTVYKTVPNGTVGGTVVVPGSGGTSSSGVNSGIINGGSIVGSAGQNK